MKSLLQQSRLAQLLEQRNSYLVMLCGLLALCLMLTTLCFYLANREKVIITPPVMDRTFWVTNSEVSPDYLTKMTVFYSGLRFNVTPDSADYQRQLLLRYTDPCFYGEFNDQLVAERDRIIQQHVTTAFYPVATEINAKALTVIITGDLISSVGTTELPPQRVAYQWQYRFNNGQLLIKQLQEVKPHA